MIVDALEKGKIVKYQLGYFYDARYNQEKGEGYIKPGFSTTSLCVSEMTVFDPKRSIAVHIHAVCLAGLFRYTKNSVFRSRICESVPKF